MDVNVNKITNVSISIAFEWSCYAIFFDTTVCIHSIREFPFAYRSASHEMYIKSVYEAFIFNGKIGFIFLNFISVCHLKEQIITLYLTGTVKTCKNKHSFS